MRLWVNWLVVERWTRFPAYYASLGQQLLQVGAVSWESPPISCCGWLILLDTATAKALDPRESVD